jgi:carboxyl-terminal processing protease
VDVEEKKKLTKKWIMTTILVAVIAFAAASVLTARYIMSEAGLTNLFFLKQEEPSDNAKTNINKITSNLGVLRTIVDSSYVGEVKEEDLMNGALKGYIQGLGDDYTEYMTKEEWEEFESTALGDFVGIGIYIGQDKNGNSVVLSPIKGSPAEEAGLEKGDIIAKVDDEDMLGKNPDIVSSKIKGEEGTKVNVSVYREDELLDFTIERAQIQVYHVESEVVEKGIGYVEILSFDENCDDELHEKIEEFRKQGIKKIIIDLRYNGGGLVESATNMLDELIPKGAIQMYTVDKDGNEQVYRSNGNGYKGDLEIAVLVNEYTASASEILSAALKENGKAKIVGTTSFGKGVIQTVFPLTNGARLKVTTEEYYTPEHNKLNHVGVEPDVVVEYDEEQNEENMKKVGDVYIDNQIQAAIDALK